MNQQPDICPLCGGNKIPGSATFSADVGSGVVVVRDVQATVCSQCGEEWIDDATARKLEHLVNDARSRGLQVEVLAMA
jgi:YgiT-type zinc finger domain-containing protein